MDREKIIERMFHPAILVEAYPSKDIVKERLLKEKNLVFYYGIDPTGPDVHLGHVIQLLQLKRLIQLGHKAILLFGDFTARIGDPTGKDTTRRPLTEEDVKINLKNYLSQVEKILEKGSFEVRHNQEWLGALNFGEILKIAGHFTVQQMIERDMFQKRISEGNPIGLHEFLYPLMQGYDSVAMDVDGEIGGNDQTFNMLVGRDLLKKIKGKDKVVFTTRLLEDSRTGKKMSKSEGGLISISDPPRLVYEKVMNSIPDDMVPSIFEMCTDVPLSKIKDERNLEQHEKLALELTRMFYSVEDANQAREDFKNIAHGGVPETMPEGSFVDDIAKTLATHFGISNSEAHRKIKEGAVSINGKILPDAKEKAKPGDVLRVGRKFLKII